MLTWSRIQRVLSALEKEAKSVIDQVGPAPKKGITQLGWSAKDRIFLDP